MVHSDRQRYEKIDFQVADLESAAGGKVTLSDDKVDVLMGRYVAVRSATEAMPEWTEHKI